MSRVPSHCTLYTSLRFCVPMGLCQESGGWTGEESGVKIFLCEAVFAAKAGYFAQSDTGIFTGKKH